MVPNGDVKEYDRILHDKRIPGRLQFQVDAEVHRNGDRHCYAEDRQGLRRTTPSSPQISKGIITDELII